VLCAVGIEVAMCCISDVLVTGLNVYASALDQSLYIKGL
jgi:hypothetical protein